MFGGAIAALEVVTALDVEQRRENNGGGNNGRTENSAFEVASVLDGALELLAGEVTRAVNAAEVRTVDDRGGSRTVDHRHSGNKLKMLQRTNQMNRWFDGSFYLPFLKLISKSALLL